MTFFKQAFMLVVYVYFVPFVAIERQLKALFCIFFQIPQVIIILFIPNFAYCFLDMYM